MADITSTSVPIDSSIELDELIRKRFKCFTVNIVVVFLRLPMP